MLAGQINIFGPVSLQEFHLATENRLEMIYPTSSDTLW